MRLLDKEHLAFLRTLPCCLCGDNTATEAAHVRMADARISKPLTGNSIKPDDVFTVPLCSKHHRLQHSMSERAFWAAEDKDPVLLALALYAYTGDAERAERVMFG